MKAPPAPPRQDAAYSLLRQWLTVGEVLPGQRLKIHDIAQRLGVGVMPVRAALQRLAAEGALVNVPHAGVMVPRLSVAEFDDVLDTRLMLEGIAAERGAHRIDADGVAGLEALDRRMAQALDSGDGKDYLAANELFHVRLYQAAGSPMLMSLIETVWLKIGPLSNRLFDAEGASSVLNHAHGDALQALRRRDCTGVRRAIERDLFVAAQFLRPFCA